MASATRPRPSSDSSRRLRETWRAPDVRPDSGSGSGRRPPASAPVVGSWVVTGELGRGAMGVVYRARHLRLTGREVALKVIAATVDDDNARARFQREGEALARLSHPNIVGVHDAGLLGDGRPYLVMELVQGQDLQELADDVGTLPAAEAAELLEPVARAVAHMHARNVLHRDLKLANVVLDDERRPRVLDFGFANLTDRRTRLTVSREILGTPLCMAPEVIRDGNSEAPQEDLYALGVMLYRLTIGRFPFYASTLDDLFHLIERAPVELPGDVDPQLARVLLRCLAKDPRARYVDAEALADDLAALAAGEVVSAEASSRWAAFAGTLERRRRPVVAALCLLILGLSVAITAALWARGAPPPAAATPPSNAARKQADQRAAALTRFETLGRTPDLAEIERLGRRFDALLEPPPPLGPEDRRFVAAHAALCYLRGDRSRARAIATRVDAADGALSAHVRGLLEPDPSAVGRLLDASPDRDRLLATLQRLAGSRERSSRSHLTEGLVRLRLGWPAGAARAFERALDALGSWPGWLEPVSFRIRDGGARRVLPLGLAARCGLARARVLLLDERAASSARERPAALLEAIAEPNGPAELRALETAVLPQTAPAFLREAEVELAAVHDWPRWQETRRASARSLRPATLPQVEAAIAAENKGLLRRLDRAERALRLAVRQGAAPVRIAVARGRVALGRGDRAVAAEQLRRAEEADPQAWQVHALAAQLRFAERDPTAGAARALKAVERLGAAGLRPVPLAARRYAVLLEAYEALQAGKTAAPTETLRVLEALSDQARGAPFAPDVVIRWDTELLRVAELLDADAVAGRARENLKRDRALALEHDQLRRAGTADAIVELRRRDPLAAASYLLPVASARGPLGPRLDALTHALLIEPMPTLLELGKRYAPADRFRTEPRALDALKRPPDARLPTPPDPDLRRSLYLLRDLWRRVRTTPAERAAGLAAIERFRARLPWSRAGALVSGLLRLELGDPDGAVTELLRTELLGPLVADKSRLTIVWLHYHLARARAALGHTKLAVSRLQRGLPRGRYLAAPFLIDAEPRFRADPSDSTSLLKAYAELKALQRR